MLRERSIDVGVNGSVSTVSDAYGVGMASKGLLPLPCRTLKYIEYSFRLGAGILYMEGWHQTKSTNVPGLTI